MTDIPEIRRHDDGSIDTAYYLAKGRYRRGEAASGMVGQFKKKVGHLLVRRTGRTLPFGPSAPTRRSADGAGS